MVKVLAKPTQIATRFLPGLIGAWHPSDPGVGTSNPEGPRNIAVRTSDEGSHLVSSNITRVGTPEGMAWDFPLTSDTTDFLQVADTNDAFDLPAGTGRRTFAVRYKVRAVHANTRGGILARGSNFSPPGWFFYYDESTSNTLFAVTAFNAGAVVSDSASNFEKDKWFTAVFWADTNITSNNLFLRIGTGSTVGSASSVSSKAAIPLLFGAASPSGGASTQRLFDGQIAWVAAWDRILSDGEISQVIRDGVFKEAPISTARVPAAAGGSISATLPVVFGATAALTSVTQIATTLPVAFGTTALLTSTTQISATAPVVFGLTADLQDIQTGAISATEPVVFASTASLTSITQLVATAPVVFASTANLVDIAVSTEPVDVFIPRAARQKIRRMQREAEKKRKQLFEDEIEARREAAKELEEIYDRVVHGTEPDVAERAAEIVRPLARDKAIIPEAVDFYALAGRADLLARLASLVGELETEMINASDEEDLLLMMVI